MSKLYKSKVSGPVGYGQEGQSIVLTEGQQFDEGSDIVVSRPDLFEDAGEKPETSLNAMEAAAGHPLPPEETGQPLLADPSPAKSTSTKSTK